MRKRKIRANTFRDWSKMYWLFFLFGLAFVAWLVTRLIPSNGEKPRVLQLVKNKFENMKVVTKRQIETTKEEFDARKKELSSIYKIGNTEERLRRLVEFANRGSK